jgi:hypothetical protein
MWYSFSSSSPVDQTTVSFWQSTRWRDLLLASGQAEQVDYWSDGVSGILVEIRSIGLGQYGAFLLGVSREQLGWDGEILISTLISQLGDMGILFLQIEPVGQVGQVWGMSLKGYISIRYDVWVSQSWDIGLSNRAEQPYKRFLTPYTRILDLTLTETDLMAQMHEKCRYNIRLAEKRGVTVSIVPPTPEHIDIWMDLLRDTTTRDGFSGNNRGYYDAFLTVGWGELYFARYEDRVIAAGIWITTDMESIYYYGASSSADRRHMAPYLIQWTAIQIAKSRDIPIYDFLWVADPSDPTDPLIGVTEFKSRFWWSVITLPEKVLIPLSWRYRVFRMVQKTKNLLF